MSWPGVASLLPNHSCTTPTNLAFEDNNCNPLFEIEYRPRTGFQLRNNQKTSDIYLSWSTPFPHVHTHAARERCPFSTQDSLIICRRILNLLAHPPARFSGLPVHLALLKGHLGRLCSCQAQLRRLRLHIQLGMNQITVSC
jgi:hypothetical protein